MALTTPSAALTQYAANCLYDVHGSTSECTLFIEACRVYLAMAPKQAKLGRVGGEQTMSPELVAEELNKAVLWLRTNRAASAGGGSVRSVSTENYRNG